MTQQECIDAAIRRVGANHVPRGTLLQLATEALEPMTRRDETVVDGKGLVDAVDPETGKHSTREVQLHAPRMVAPFWFGPAEVEELARAIRRELKI